MRQLVKTFLYVGDAPRAEGHKGIVRILQTNYETTT